MQINDHKSPNSRSALLRSSVILGSSVAFFALAQTANAAAVTQTAGDVFGSSSLNEATNWSDSTVPTAGNDYSTSVLFRTPSDGLDHVFAGDSLTLNSGSNFLYKGSTILNPTLTVPLILNGGSMDSSGFAFTLDGTLDLQANTQFKVYNGLTTIDSLVTGDSAYRFVFSGTGLAGPDATGGVVLTNGSNTFEGGMYISENTSVYATADGALGTGNIRMIQGASLTLSGAYLSEQTLITANDNIAAINLDFTGTNVIEGITLNAGTFGTAGSTYGAIGSGADVESALITGTGLLRVVPEPATSGLLIGALALCGVMLRRAKR